MTVLFSVSLPFTLLLIMALYNLYTLLCAVFRQLVWLNPTMESHEVAWDYSMCTTQSAGTEVGRLMAKAFKAALTLPQQDTLLNALKKDPKLVYHIGKGPYISLSYR